jgi:hypothetical protein
MVRPSDADIGDERDGAITAAIAAASVIEAY